MISSLQILKLHFLAIENNHTICCLCLRKVLQRNPTEQQEPKSKGQFHIRIMTNIYSAKQKPKSNTKTTKTMGHSGSKFPTILQH